MNNESIKYNIRLNVKTLKTIFSLFDMNEKNSIIELVTSNDNTVKNIDEYKSNVIKIVKNEKNTSIYLKNIKFEKIYYFLSKNLVFNVYYYKAKNIDNLSHTLKNNTCDVSIHTRMDKIYEIVFDKNKYDCDRIRKELKKFRTINIELIVLIILIIIGIILRFVRK